MAGASPPRVAVISEEGAARIAAGEIKDIRRASEPGVELPVLVSTDPHDAASAPPKTVMAAFEETVRDYGTIPAMAVKRAGQWVQWTWREYYEETRRFGRALLALGVQRNAGVAIIGFNSPEWFIANMGAIFAGGVAAGIYTTNTPEACWFVAHDCAAEVIVCDTAEQVAKVQQVRARLPALKAVVQWLGEPAAASGAMSWRQFMGLGGRVTDETLEERMRAQRPGHCCELIYSSGTTGRPKGVMLSHDNLTWTSACTVSLVENFPGDSVVSYLPLSHIAAQVVDMHGPMAMAATTFFAQPDALKGTLVDTLRDVRPAIVMGVPRVWEKMEERIKAVGAANGGLKKQLADWAKSVGTAGNIARVEGKPLPWGWSVAEVVVFNNVKAALGFENVRIRVTGAAPIHRSTLEYFQSLDMPIYETYGLSESTGPQTINLPGVGAMRLGTVGRPLPGVEIKIDNPSPSGEGEVCIRSRSIFMGYLKMEEATKEAIDDEGWFRSGDLGVMDRDGFLRITGRIKELLITAGGENVAPVPIEDRIKAAVPALANVMVVGDRQRFLAALVTLRTEPDEDMQPTDVLDEVSLALCRSVGCDARTVGDALTHPGVRRAVEAGIKEANANTVSRAQLVRKWELLPADFSVATGELTPTLKLKRRVVLQKYDDVVKSIYGEEAAPAAGAKAKL